VTLDTSGSLIEAVISAHDDLAQSGLLLSREIESMRSAGFVTVADLLDHFPKRHEDRRQLGFPVSSATLGPICFRAEVVDTMQRRFGRGKGFFEAVLIDAKGGLFGSSRITCRWYNMPFMNKVLAAGQQIVAHGKLKEHDGRFFIDHPEFEILREDDFEGDSIHLNRIVPVYRNISGVPQRRLREIMHEMIGLADPASFDVGIDVGSGVARFDEMRLVHFPSSLEIAKSAARRFALEEFFSVQLNVLWRRQNHRRLEGRSQGRKTTLLKSFYASLPFDLTGAQKRSIREIIEDMRDPRPMARLMQGDVGSGKTFVAMAAMLMAVDSGAQAALMAPTQILAEQHFLTFRKWLEPLGIRIALRTASRDEMTHDENELSPQMIIGTHALIHGGGNFEDLGLVVIDEQHKFGVDQRAALIGKGRAPDVLVMTATPIPRTLTMTLYGDLDVSVLDEKPAGRGEVVTALRFSAKQSDVTSFVKEKLAEGRQAYLIYPLVEESEGLKVESAVVAHAKWKKRLSGHEVGLIHGKLRADEKERVMQNFRDGKIGVLVATSVIEVGVDVPNASLMVVHHADRFGMAQLHQLRGRIGRGGNKGYCILLSDGKNPEAMEKLKVLEQTGDGFEIAEADMRLRGPGDVLGTSQSGLAELKFVEFLADPSLIREAGGLAAKVLAEDPDLSGRHASLLRLIKERLPEMEVTGGTA
jgi:ATP-dependent DNA helicase RecG